LIRPFHLQEDHYFYPNLISQTTILNSKYYFLMPYQYKDLQMIIYAKVIVIMKQIARTVFIGI